MQLVLKRRRKEGLQDDGSNPSHPNFELSRRTIPECLIFQRSSGAAVQCLPMFFSPNQSIWRYLKMTNKSVASLCFWHLPYIEKMIQFVDNIVSTSFNPNCTLLYLQVGAMEPWPSDVQLFQPYEVTCLTLKSMIAP